jgi:hypothetical protein
MRMKNSIEDILEKYVTFKSPRSNSWRRVYCEVCGDGTHAKGPRGGWLFKDDSAFYNCFNCGIDGSFDPSRDHPLSKDMKKIFDSFNVPYSDYVILSKKTDKKTGKKTTSVNKITQLKIPEYFTELKLSQSHIGTTAKEFLLNEKCINYKDYDFYVIDQIAPSLSPEDKALAKFAYGRLVIPSYHNGRMIYYETRDLGISNNSTKKYLTPKGVSKAKSFYFYDRIYQNTNTPLFICEGFFDAYHVNGIATMENDLSSYQEDVLKKTSRPIVVIPDNNGDSNTLVEKCLRNNWGVSFVDESCKDVTESVKKFGKMITFYNLSKNIKMESSAKAFAKMRLKNLSI